MSANMYDRQFWYLLSVQVVQHCVSCLGAIVNKVTHNYKFVWGCFNRFYGKTACITNHVRVFFWSCLTAFCLRWQHKSCFGQVLKVRKYTKNVPKSFWIFSGCWLATETWLFSLKLNVDFTAKLSNPLDLFLHHITLQLTHLMFFVFVFTQSSASLACKEIIEWFVCSIVLKWPSQIQDLNPIQKLWN